MINNNVRPKKRDCEQLLVGTLTCIIVFALLAPIFVVLAMSFTASTSLQFPPQGLSLRWYEALIGRHVADSLLVGDRLYESIVTTLQIAFVTATTCMLCGVPAAYAIVRSKFRGKSTVEMLVSLPIVFPAIVLGIALLIVISNLRFDLGIWQIALAHTILLMPFMIRNCVAALQGQDPSLLEAATILGARPARGFFEIVLPLMKTGIISGYLLVFIMSFNEFTLAYFLYTIDVFPLSMWLFQQSNTSLNPAIFAVSSVIIIINICVIIMVDRWVGKRGMPL